MIRNIFFSTLFLLFFISCGPSVHNLKYQGSDYFGQFDGGAPSGFGIQKNSNTISIGKFSYGQREGWFKIINNDGTVVYKFFKNGQTSKDEEDLLFSSNFIAKGKPVNVSDSKKVFGLNLQNGEHYFGEIKEFKTFWGVRKTDYGLIHVGFQPVPSSYMANTYLLLPTGAKLYGAKAFPNSFNVNHYVSHTGQKIESTYDEKTVEKSWGDIQAWVPSTNILAPEILITRFKNGDLYIGEGKNFKANGHGYLKYKNGLEVWGWFENNRLEGDGIELRNKRELYAGSYKNGKRHGVFIPAGKVPTYKFNESFNLERYQSMDAQFKKLENWYYENKSKETDLAEVPYEKDFEFSVNPSDIINYSLEYDANTFRPSSLKITNRGDRGYFPENSIEAFYLGISSGLISPGAIGLIDSLSTKNYKISGTRYVNGAAKGSFTSSKLEKCQVKLSQFNYGDYKSIRPMVFYGENCKSSKTSVRSSILTDSTLSVVIYNAKVEDGKLTDGEAHFYGYKERNGFIGRIARGSYQGKIRFIKYQGNDLYADYSNGVINGDVVSPGVSRIYHRNGKANGKGMYFENNTLYNGLYSNDRRNGKFSFKNFTDDTTGTLNFSVNGRRHGEYLEKDKKGKIFERYTYIEGQRSGKGLCRYKDKTETCEFKDDKRVDSTYKKHKQRAIETEERRKRWLADFYARKAREEREKRREAREWREREERRKAVQARIKRAAREYENQKFQNAYKEMLHNHMKQNSFYSNFTKYGSGIQNAPPVSTKPAVTTVPSSSSVKLKDNKPYKRCELSQNFEGKKFATFYDCNDKDATLPGARKELQRKITHYADTLRIQRERKEKAEREDKEYKSSLNDACAKHLRNGGDVCDKICVDTSYGKGKKCRTGAF